MRTSITAAFFAAATASLVSACAPEEPPPEPIRPVRAAEIRYGAERTANRYFGAVHARYEVDQAFRVGAEIVERRVDVGDSVREGDIVARLDDTDYRLAEEAARQQLDAAQTRQRQAESDWRRLQALKLDGSVAEFDDEHAQSELSTARAAAEAKKRELELARNQVEYTVLHASIDGVVTNVQFEVGQVVAAGQAIVTIANERAPEIVVDVPEDQLDTFKTAHYRATLASAPNDAFEVVLRELSAQATPQTRTYRARLRPAAPRNLPLGASATLIAEHDVDGPPVAAIPASALTQSGGQAALWAVRQDDPDAAGTVELVRVTLHGYRNDEVLVSGPPESTLVVTAGVQKMSPGLRVALPQSATKANNKQAAR